MASDSETTDARLDADPAAAGGHNALSPGRRDFLARAGGLVGGGWLTLNAPLLMAAAHSAVAQRREQSGWVNLSDGEARNTAAVVDRIFPPDDQPGAVEIGVVFFVDQALGGLLAARADVFRNGLADLEQRAMERSPGSGGFAALPPDVQDELLAAVETTPFFGMALLMTHAGLFALPSWGGNRSKAGWAIVGFDDRHAWQPPFGYYDAQVMQEGERDAG